VHKNKESTGITGAVIIASCSAISKNFNHISSFRQNAFRQYRSGKVAPDLLLTGRCLVVRSGVADNSGGHSE
jgi:hypothetical protein